MEILGMLGSFIGVIPGIILYVVLTRINFYGSIAAIVMYYGAVGGYHFLIEKLKKKDYDEFDEFQERKSRFNTITRENFSPFGMVFSAIPGIIGVRSESKQSWSTYWENHIICNGKYILV